jgi:hypothetical protein
MRKTGEIIREMRVNLGKYGGKYQESLIGPPFRTNSCRFMGKMIRNPRYGCQRPLFLGENWGKIGKKGVFLGVKFGARGGEFWRKRGDLLGRSHTNREIGRPKIGQLINV